MTEWPTVALRHIARLEYGDALPGDARIDGDVPVVGSGGTDSTHNHANSGPGPAIVVGRKGSAGSVRWFDEPVHVIDTAYWVRTGSRIDSRFLYYVLSVQRWSETTQDVGVPGLSRDLAHATKVLLPPLDEQRRIADFLDTETARLDTLLAYAARQVALAEEARHARLEASASRIGRHVPLKRLLDGPGQYGLNVSSDAYRNDGARLLRTTDIGTRGRLSPAASPIMVEAPADRRFHLLAGDVLVSRAGSIGTALVVDGSMTNMTFAGYLVRLRPSAGTHPAYLADVLQLPSVQSRIRRDAVESTILNFNAERYGSLLVPAPGSAATQMTLSSEWSAWKDRTEFISLAVERMQHLLAERRQALITAAVTGQLDVTTARGGRS